MLSRRIRPDGMASENGLRTPHIDRLGQELTVLDTLWIEQQINLAKSLHLLGVVETPRSSGRLSVRVSQHADPGRQAALSTHPPVVVGRFIPTELSGELRTAVERWAAQQADKPTLPEAVRRLIEDGFATD